MTRHRWVRQWPDRERRCERCGIVARRYGIGRASYWGYRYPSEGADAPEDDEDFPLTTPPCTGGAP